MSKIEQPPSQSDSATIVCEPIPVERLRVLLPWLDEEEAPPCIGERYRDALRPRPLDD